ncbi:hypothetical protein M3Y99_01474900 [Aphelenchoides fujianensis]|nr:hypothetical protein M3Y99_01474900 [Aphelenchoides fujianensis]
MYAGRGFRRQDNLDPRHRTFQVRNNDADPQRPKLRYSVSPPRNTGNKSISLFADYSKDPAYESRPMGWRETATSSPSRHPKGGQQRNPAVYPNRRHSRSPPPRMDRRRSRSPTFSLGRRSRSRSPPPVRGRAYCPHYNVLRLNGRFQWGQPRIFAEELVARTRSWTTRRLLCSPKGRPIFRSQTKKPLRIADGTRFGRGGSGPVFRQTFKPVEKKEKKVIKIAAPKELPRKESPDIIEVDVNGHRIRNAPPVPKASKRSSRWDRGTTEQDPRQLLSKQGVANPDEALQKIANLPTMDKRYKTSKNDDDAVQKQLQMLAQQERLSALKKTLPPSVALPTPIAFSAIGKAPLKQPAPLEIPQQPPPAIATAAMSVPPAPAAAVFPAVGIPPAGALSFPPPGFPQMAAGMMPPFVQQPPNVMPALGMPPIGVPRMGLGPPPIGVAPTALVNPAFLPNTSLPPPQVAANPPPPIPEVQLDPTEQLFRARADLYRRDLSRIRTIPNLIEYMWSQGHDPIPDSDPPLLFNEVLKKRQGILGASALYQIICFGHPELETYYCGMCNHWTTISEMFAHLMAPMHRMNYLHRNYKVFHNKANDLEDPQERDKFLNAVSQKVWAIEGSGQCGNRMRCILNIDAIKQIWPDYEVFVDNSWKVMDELILPQNSAQQLDERPVNAVEDPRPPNVQPATSSREPAASAGRADEKGRHESRERSPHGSRSRARSRGRSRSRSREKSKKSRRRPSKDSRRRMREESPSHRSKASSRDSKYEWDRRAAELIAQIGNDGVPPAPGTSRAEADLESERAAQRRRSTNEAEEKQKTLRRALAMIIELQRVQDSQGFVERSMVDGIAAEMGFNEEDLQKNQVLSNGLANFKIVESHKPAAQPAAPSRDSTKSSGVSLESLGLSVSDVHGWPNAKIPPPQASDRRPANGHHEQRPAAQKEGANQFDAAKVETDWYIYYKANPQSIGTAERSEFNEEAYDEFYGKGTFKAFQEAKRRAAERAKALHAAKLKHPNAPHSYYETF